MDQSELHPLRVNRQTLVKTLPSLVLRKTTDLDNVSCSKRQVYNVRRAQRGDAALYSLQNDPRSVIVNSDWNAEQADDEQGDHQTCNTKRYEMTIRVQERLNKNHWNAQSES